MVRLLRVTNARTGLTAPSRKTGVRERCCSGRFWVRMVAAFSEFAGQRGGARIGHASVTGSLSRRGRSSDLSWCALAAAGQWVGSAGP